MATQNLIHWSGIALLLGGLSSGIAWNPSGRNASRSNVNQPRCQPINKNLMGDQYELLRWAQVTQDLGAAGDPVIGSPTMLALGIPVEVARCVVPCDRSQE